MQGWLNFLVQILILVVFVYIAYAILKRYVLSKVKVNKWVILVLAVACFFIPVLLELVGIKSNNILVQYIEPALFAILLLWYLDITGFGPKRMAKKAVEKGTSEKRTTRSTYTTYQDKTSNNKVVIKPKAKPNRLKSGDMEIVKAKEEKKFFFKKK